MEVSVVIPTHNRADALDKTLAHLRSQVFDQAWEVFVVNNNCSDHTDQVVEKYRKDFPAPLSLVHESKPGAAAARNAGARRARGEYLLFIDNDILTKPDFIERHYANLIRGRNCWFVGYVENLPEMQQTPFGKFRKSIETPLSKELCEIPGITGQSVSMAKEEFISLNGFDENFHVASGEDLDLAIRARKNGIRIFFDPLNVAQHNDWAGATIRDFCERQRLYSQTDPYFWQKYGNETPRLKMVKENLPPSLKQDGLRLYCWKKTKHILGSKPGQRILIGLSEVCEKIFPYRFILWRLYRLAIAGAIYRGFNEGLKIFSVKQRAVLS